MRRKFNIIKNFNIRLQFKLWKFMQSSQTLQEFINSNSTWFNSVIQLNLWNQITSSIRALRSRNKINTLTVVSTLIHSKSSAQQSIYEMNIITSTQLLRNFASHVDSFLLNTYSITQLLKTLISQVNSFWLNTDYLEMIYILSNKKEDSLQLLTRVLSLFKNMQKLTIRLKDAYLK